jgi:hypothetical protein
MSHLDGMPSHGAEIIDGIPVILRDSVMYAFQLGVAPTIKLGTYDAATKVAKWAMSDEIAAWLSTYKEGLTSRSRK